MVREGELAINDLAATHTAVTLRTAEAPYTSACLFFLFLSVEAIFVVPIKIYPFCFILFSACVGLWFLAGNGRRSLPWQRTKLWVPCFAYLVYAAGLFWYSGGDRDFALRLAVNVIFFLAVSAFLLSLHESHERWLVRRTITRALFAAIAFSAIQTLVNVARGHLWLQPALITNSVDAYAIQNAGAVLFGDQNKNIWATKTLLAYLVFSGLRWQQGRRRRGVDTVAFLSFLIVLAYTSSRTAQLAFLVGWGSHWLHERWPKLRAVGRVGLGLLAGGGVFVAVGVSRVLDLGNVNLLQGTGGDGFLGRLTLWLYLYFAAPRFSWQQVIFGHGVSAVTGFVSRAFAENNLHNVFLNQFFDLGLIGLALYTSFLVFSFRFLGSRGRWLFAPAVLVIISSQYFGFDPELMLFFAMSVLVGQKYARQRSAAVLRTIQGMSPARLQPS